MVINTMGWIEGLGYELILHAIDALSANVVLVLGQEKVFSMLRDVLKNRPNVHVVKLQNQVVFYLGIQKFDKRPDQELVVDRRPQDQLCQLVQILDRQGEEANHLSITISRGPTGKYLIAGTLSWIET
ncbi:hypothetical protein ACOSQ2_027487 [Xanthoceras sorbifolium]